MTTAAWVLLVAACVVAAADWVAVWRRPSPAPSGRGSGTHESWLKPLTLLLLIGLAVTVDPVDDGQRLWFVLALALSLAGDVFLLPSVDRFVPGLASFLLAHVAYVVGFLQVDDIEREAAVLAVLLLAPVAVKVVTAVRHREPELTVPVVGYVAVIAAMVASALRYGNAVGIAGASLFAVSDSVLAIDRFDRHRRWMPVTVMVTYHVAQALLVLSLVVEP